MASLLTLLCHAGLSPSRARSTRFPDVFHRIYLFFVLAFYAIKRSLPCFIIHYSSPLSPSWSPLSPSRSLRSPSCGQPSPPRFLSPHCNLSFVLLPPAPQRRSLVEPLRVAQRVNARHHPRRHVRHTLHRLQVHSPPAAAPPRRAASVPCKNAPRHGSHPCGFHLRH